jgi:Big-like domain-containing protein
MRPVLSHVVLEYTMSRFQSLAGLGAFTVVLLGGCSDSSGPATAQLTAVSPTPAATAVAPSTTITLTFSAPMMTGMEQYIDLHQGGVSGPIVPMACTWSPDGTTVTCTPGAPLAGGTQYTIHMGAGMTDDQGHMMDLDEWTGMGGQWAMGGMMGGTHAGQPIGMMGAGWTHGTHYGMLFSFTTA